MTDRRRERVCRLVAKRPRERQPDSVELQVEDRQALVELAEALGEIAADLWLDGKLEIA